MRSVTSPGWFQLGVADSKLCFKRISPSSRVEEPNPQCTCLLSKSPLKVGTSKTLLGIRMAGEGPGSLSGLLAGWSQNIGIPRKLYICNGRGPKLKSAPGLLESVEI